MEALARGRRTTIHCMAWPQKLGILLVIQTYQLQAGLVGFVFHLFWLFFHLQTRITERETGCALPAIQHHRGGGRPRTHSPTFLPGRGHLLGDQKCNIRISNIFHVSQVKPVCSSPLCPLSRPLFWLCSPSPSLSSLCLGGAHCELSLLAHAPAPKHTLVIHLVLWPLLKAVALISLSLDYWVW